MQRLIFLVDCHIRVGPVSADFPIWALTNKKRKIAHQRDDFRIYMWTVSGSTVSIDKKVKNSETCANIETANKFASLITSDC